MLGGRIRPGTAVVAAVLVCVTAASEPAAVAQRLAGHPALRPLRPKSARPQQPTLPALPALTLRQLAGQRAIYSYKGLIPPQSLLDRIRAGEVAGVIFFGQNISSHAQIGKVIAELQRAAKDSPVHAPLLMMTDQEGGRIRRLTGEPTLSEKQIGLSAHPARAAAAAGTGAGQNLRGVGMNVNLAPVLDVFRKPGDFDDQFERSYSNDAKVVSTLGAAFVRAQQAARVAATAKHFPGLGAASTKQNTDQVPVTLRLSTRTLRSVDESPYRSSIGAGVKLVMVSWATYPTLDARRPAGLSSRIVQGELRGRLGFQGVTVTDAIEAGALRSFGSDGNRGVLAAGAGMDLMLYSAQDVNQGVAGVTALTDALKTGTLDPAAFRLAVQRILALRQSLA